MKRSRVLPIVLAVGLLGAAAVSALDVDFGGSIDNSSTPTVTMVPASPAFGMDQRNKAALWMDMRFGSTVSLAAQGSYSFSLLVPYIFDIDYLNVNWQALPSLKLTAGRFVFSDFTGHVLNHKLDGAMVTASFPIAVITAGAGYSGFVLRPSSLILMSRTDSADSSAFFAAPRIIEKIDAVVPNIFPRQDLTLAVVLQQDLRASTALIQPGQQQQSVSGLYGGSLSTQYWGIGLSGAIVSALYYNSFLFLSTGSTLSYVEDPASGTGFSYQYAPILAFLGGIGLRYFNEGFLSSRAELEAVFSSGDADTTLYQEGNTSGTSNMFVPISQDTLGIAFQPQWGNLLLIDANYSLKPFSRSPTVWKSLQLMLKVLNFLRPTTGAISPAAGLNAGSTDLYLGTEVDAIANFRPLSDLGTALSFGVFMPNLGAFTGTAAQPVIAGRLEVSFSF